MLLLCLCCASILDLIRVRQWWSSVLGIETRFIYMNIQIRLSNTYHTYIKQNQSCCTWIAIIRKQHLPYQLFLQSLQALLPHEKASVGVSDGLIKGSWQVACALCFGPSSVWHILLSVKNGNLSLSRL